MTDQSRPDGGKPPFPTKDSPPKPGAEKKPAKPVTEDALDEAIQETFPASDPVSVGTQKPQDER